MFQLDILDPADPNQAITMEVRVRVRVGVRLRLKVGVSVRVRVRDGGWQLRVE